MTEVGFYQLMSRPLEAVLPRLLDKAVAAGFRVRIASQDAAQLQRLDAALWSHDPESFLPHAIDGEFAAAQPILLSTQAGNPNGADLLGVIDGALPADLHSWKRILYLFDGNDALALGQARQHWKAVAAAEAVTPVYWKESGRGWEKAG